MKNIKKMMAIVLVAVMTMMYAVPLSFAAAGDLTPDGSISVTGIHEGDVASVYQFISWDTTTSNWLVDTDAGLALDAIADGLTKDELGTIAQGYSGFTKIGSDVTIGSDGKLELTTADNNLPVGAFLVLIKDTNNDHLYNPIVVANDYNGDGNTVALPDSEGMAKMQEIDITKTATNGEPDYTVDAGDIVPFTVTGAVPTYNTNWTNPLYKITDSLSQGLTIQTVPTVTVEGYTVAAGTDYNITKKGGTGAVVVGDDGYEVTFTKSFLNRVSGNPTYTISYSALVGDAVKANAQIHEETNTATVTYSNNPQNESDHGTDTDITHHYTFAIDCNRFGSTTEKTGELIKVAVDDEGNAVEVYKESEALPSTATPLEGATFTLTNTTNGYSQEYTTQSDGSIVFNNLEEGTYTLKETHAPAGYKFDATEHTVVIDAEFDFEGVLTGYTITIDNEATSTYTATTSSEDGTLTEITPPSYNDVFPFNNVKAATLPSTGGIGTTLFYLIGTILVLGAGVLMVTRRRMKKFEQ